MLFLPPAPLDYMIAAEQSLPASSFVISYDSTAFQTYPSISYTVQVAKAQTSKIIQTPPSLQSSPVIQGVPPKDAQPKLVDSNFSKNYALMGLFGPFTPKTPLLKASFPINAVLSENISNYYNMPKRAFRTIPESHIFSFAVRPGMFIPVGYVPPTAKKPVILLSPGAAARLDEYEPFLEKLHQQRYGILIYQLSLLNEQNQFIRQDKTFKAVENRFIDDLNQLSQALAKGTFETVNNGALKVEPVSYERQVLAGHSSGGIISAYVAGQTKRPYHSLFLLATPLSFQDATIRLGKNLAPTWLNLLVPDRWATMAFNNAFELPAALSEVNIPVHYLQGENDLLVGKAIYNQIHKNSILRDKISDFNCIATAGHNQLLNRPDQGGNGLKVAELMITTLSDTLSIAP